MSTHIEYLNELGRFSSIPRVPLVTATTPLEAMQNLSSHLGGANIFVKRDDCSGLAFGGNKVRQLEFYFGDAISQKADTILITSAVQSNFVRCAAAAACKLGMDCHVQLEQRVQQTDDNYRNSGNVLINKLLGATIHTFPNGEDEAGADEQLQVLAQELKSIGKRPYVIPLAPGHPPLGALGYVVASLELLTQIAAADIKVDRILVGSGSGATHAGLLFGLRAFGSKINVVGVCVRRNAELQFDRIKSSCEQIATLIGAKNVVDNKDILLTDRFLAPGYGVPSDAVLDAIVLAARTEGLIVDPVYTGKVLAATIDASISANRDTSLLFIHTGGTPAVFAYQDILERASARHCGYDRMQVAHD